jgi:hypothetical protein
VRSNYSCRVASNMVVVARHYCIRSSDCVAIAMNGESNPMNRSIVQLNDGVARELPWSCHFQTNRFGCAKENNFQSPVLLFSMPHA